jgi:serine/threonine protein kinase
LVYFHGASATDSHLVVTLEFVDGKDLLTLLNETFKTTNALLPSADVRAILFQVLHALVYMHGKSLCHRDLKLDNIMVSQLPSGKWRCARLIDFGLSKDTGGGTGSSLSAKAPRGCFMTAGVGNHLHRSPEALLLDKNTAPGTHADAAVSGSAADVWSFGVCLFASVTGRYPFYADGRGGLCTEPSFVQALRMALGGAYAPVLVPQPSVAHLMPRVAPDDVAVLQTIFVNDPAARISAAQLLGHPWFANVEPGVRHSRAL